MGQAKLAHRRRCEKIDGGGVVRQPYCGHNRAGETIVATKGPHVMQTPSMAKDLMFKLRLDEEDRRRLRVVADHFSAPAATAVRMLIKKEYDELVQRKQLPLSLTTAHKHVLNAIGGLGPLALLDEIETELRPLYDGKSVPWVKAIVKELRDHDYVQRLGVGLGAGYVLTDKGSAVEET